MTMYGFDPFGDPWQMDRVAKQLMSGRRTPLAMPMDVWQADDGFHVCLDLPGVEPDSVEITTERNILTIKAERRPEYQDSQNVLIAERPQGSFTRQLQMSDTLDTDNIEASYGDGVLHLTVPIVRAAEPRRVQVKARGDGDRQIEVEAEPAQTDSAD
jgi:HSP20 family protein